MPDSDLGKMLLFQIVTVHDQMHFHKRMIHNFGRALYKVCSVDKSCGGTVDTTAIKEGSRVQI